MAKCREASSKCDGGHREGGERHAGNMGEGGEGQQEQGQQGRQGGGQRDEGRQGGRPHGWEGILAGRRPQHSPPLPLLRQDKSQQSPVPPSFENLLNLWQSRASLGGCAGTGRGRRRRMQLLQQQPPTRATPTKQNNKHRCNANPARRLHGRVTNVET